MIYFNLIGRCCPISQRLATTDLKKEGEKAGVDFIKVGRRV
jgi:hypothetical protein